MSPLGEHPPALALMLACLQPAPDPARIVTLCRQATASADDLSWWLRYHRTLPLVYRSLKAHAWPEVPAEVREALKREYDDNVLRGMRTAAALVKLCRLLSDRQIRHLAFKGPTLALRLHGTFDLRRAGDIDVLVDPQRIDEADAALQAAGYQLVKPDFEMSPRQKAAFRAGFAHLVHRTPCGGIAIELHWRLTANPLLLPVSFDELMRRSRVQMIGGQPVPTLSEADLAL